MGWIIFANGQVAQLDGEGAIDYSWYPNENISCSDCEDPLVYPTDDQYYVVIGTDGCFLIQMRYLSK